MRHLEPQQVLSRACEPVVALLDSRAPDTQLGSLDLGWPKSFAPTDAVLRTGGLGPTGQDITLLGNTRTMGPPRSWDWTVPGSSRLWRFHLNYWDWAHEAQRRGNGPAVLDELIRGWWGRTQYGQGDEWEPYVVSLRLWTFCGLQHLDLSPAGRADLISAVVTQQRYLSRRVEWDIRGNHLVKNLKALCGAAAFLGQKERFGQEINRAQREVSRQILRDGGHEERSPSYHVQVLLDVLDLRDLASCMGEAPAAKSLAEIAERMTAWLRTMTVHGSLPPLNDGFPVSKDVLRLIQPSESFPTTALTLLNESGYARVRTGEWEHLLDVGPLGPSHNPGHGHADSLSFLSWYAGAPLLIDTGTSTYAQGPQRAYERSTRAHNTVEVGSGDSSEVWGSFRVGRRADITLGSVNVHSEHVTVSASHDGYRATHATMVRRTWALGPDGPRISDQLVGDDTDSPPVAVTHLHLHPDLSWDGSQAVGPSGTFTVTCQDDGGKPIPAQVAMAPVAQGLDQVRDGTHLIFRWPAGTRSTSTTISRHTPLDIQEETS